jgi:predicted RNA-binding Zn-ribbon protein involved in translation (DUF1610 family)
METEHQKLVKQHKELPALKTVAGVLVKQVDRAVMNTSLRDLTGEEPTGLKVPALILKLTEYFASSQATCVSCDKCLGLSDPLATEHCPYCGEGDDVIDASKMIPALEVEMEQALKKRARKAKEVAVAVVVEDRGPLDAWRSRMTDARARTSHDLYEMATLLMECADNHYWRLERDESGALKYRTVVELFEGEFGIAKNTAHRLISIAREFPAQLVSKYSQQFVGGLFHSHAADARRVLLLEMAEEDLSEEQVKARLEILEEEKRSIRDKAKKAKAEALEPKEQLVTLVAKPQKHRVKMFTYADEDKRAKRVADRAEGVLQLERGRLHLEIALDAQGQLEVIVKALPNE